MMLFQALEGIFWREYHGCWVSTSVNWYFTLHSLNKCLLCARHCSNLHDSDEHKSLPWRNLTTTYIKMVENTNPLPKGIWPPPTSNRKTQTLAPKESGPPPTPKQYRKHKSFVWYLYCSLCTQQMVSLAK